MTTPIGWGILGPGIIARSFASDLVKVPEARLVAVGSRSKERGTAFAEEFNVPHVHESYDALLEDSDVDVIYIATPHPFHHAQALMCLQAGKAVLCEKPLAVNAWEARDMVACARENGVFLMEAMWTRFLPVIRQALAWLDEGAIGEVRLVSADFGFRGPWEPEKRWLNPAYAGGALLDVGVYPVALASMIFGGAPSMIQASAHIGESHVDEQTVMQFTYPGGALAQLSCAIRTNTAHLAHIHGTKGTIRIPSFWRATSAELEIEGQAPVTTTGEAGYQFQAIDVMNRLRNGETESPLMPLGESIAIMETMDAVRARIGLAYPME